MPNRAADWLEQAERNLRLGETAARDDLHEWACFASHQAGEMALKAVYAALIGDTRGHSLTALIRGLALPVQPGADLVERVRILDAYYIPTRYVDSHPEGAPHEHYGSLQSRHALDIAHALVGHCRAVVAQAESDRCGGDDLGTAGDGG